MKLSLKLLVKTALVVVLLSVGIKFFASGSPMSLFLRMAGELVFIFVTLWLPGYALLARYAGNWLQKHEVDLLAVPATLTVYLTLFTLLYALSAPRFIYQIIYVGGFAGLAVMEGARLRAGAELYLPRYYGLAFLLALCAASFICAGLNGSPWKLMEWTIPANVGTPPLPSDNSLQWSSASVFISGGKPWAWNDGYWNWTMGDRPALPAALTAAYAKSFLSYRKLRYFDYTLLAISLNALYVIPLAYLARRIIRNQRFALLAVVSLALTPYFFVNVYFTWPKLTGVFLTLTALAFFIGREREDMWTWPRAPGAFVLGFLLSLGALCHGGAALSAPLVLLLVAIFAKVRTARSVLVGLLASAGGYLVATLPWMAYKAAHPHIQTNNLMYHYRAVLDRPGNPMPLSQWLAQNPVGEQLATRWGHVVELLSQSEFRATLDAHLAGTLHSFYAARWPKEFFHPISQMGEARVFVGGASLAILGLAWLLYRYGSYRAWPVTRIQGLDLAKCTALFTVALLSYAANIFLKWTEHVPHALPIAEIVCMMLALSLAAYGLSRAAGHTLVFILLLRFPHFALSAGIERGHLLFNIFTLAALLSGALVVWLAASASDTPLGAPSAD